METRKILDFFAAPQVVRIELPVSGRENTFNCRVSLAGNSQLEALFPPNKLPFGELRPNLRGVLICKGDAGVFNVTVAIEKILDERHLLLRVVQSAPPVQQRNYFRADAEILLDYWPLEAPRGYQPPAPAKVNISGGGLRMVVKEPLQAGQRLGMLLILPPDQERIIECCAEVVRMFEGREGRREAAVNFIDIRPRDQDRITAFCFDQQRRLLRKKVRII